METQAEKVAEYGERTSKESLRVYQAKAKLPKAYLPLIIHFYPEIENDDTMIRRIREVMAHRSKREDIIQMIEFAAENWKKAS